MAVIRHNHRGLVIKPGLKVTPVLKMLAVSVAVVATIIVIHRWFTSLAFSSENVENSRWILADLVHIPQFAIPFVFIWHLSKGKLSDYGFNLNQKSPLRQSSHYVP